jgi:phage replication O-like protein O
MNRRNQARKQTAGDIVDDKTPQLEDGFFRIANELFEAMISGMPFRIPDPVKIFMAVMRETYGYSGRKSAEISTEKFRKITGINKRQNIYKAIRQALETKLINVIKNDYRTNSTYSINKKYEQWASVIKNDTRVIKNDYKIDSTILYNKEKYKIEKKDRVSKTITSVIKNDYALISKESIKESKDYILDPDDQKMQDKNGNVPYAEIMKLYNEILVPPLSVCRFMNPGRKQHLKARWNQFKDIQTLDWWRSYFKCISEEDWMMGRKKLKGGDVWFANFDYVIREKCIIKIREERSSGK